MCCFYRTRHFDCLFVIGLPHSNSFSVISRWWYMYEIRRRKPEPTLLPNQGIFNLPHHIGMVWEELIFYEVVDCSAAKCYNRDWDSYPCPQGHIPRTLTNSVNSPPQSSFNNEGCEPEVIEPRQWFLLWLYFLECPCRETSPFTHCAHCCKISVSACHGSQLK